MRRVKITDPDPKEQLRLLFEDSNIGGNAGIVVLNIVRNPKDGSTDELIHVCRVSNEGYNYISLTDGNRWFDPKINFDEVAKQLVDFMNASTIEAEFYKFEDIYEFSHFLRNYVDKRKARRVQNDQSL